MDVRTTHGNARTRSMGPFVPRRVRRPWWQLVARTLLKTRKTAPKAPLPSGRASKNRPSWILSVASLSPSAMYLPRRSNTAEDLKLSSSAVVPKSPEESKATLAREAPPPACDPSEAALHSSKRNFPRGSAVNCSRVADFRCDVFSATADGAAHAGSFCMLFARPFCISCARPTFSIVSARPSILYRRWKGNR
jgi:hypothetical protein